MPTWLGHYESLVQAAGHLAKVEKAVIPSLLQTRSYADAIERCGPLTFTEDEITDRVEVRLRRQHVLYDPESEFHTTNILNEYVLLNGRPRIMSEQLNHLVELAARPNVDILLLPMDGSDISAHGGFELLSRPGDTTPFMAVTLDAGGARYREDSAMIPFVRTYEYLLDIVLSPEATLHRIMIIRDRHREEQ